MKNFKIGDKVLPNIDMEDVLCNILDKDLLILKYGVYGIITDIEEDNDETTYEVKWLSDQNGKQIRVECFYENGFSSMELDFYTSHNLKSFLQDLAFGYAEMINNDFDGMTLEELKEIEKNMGMSLEDLGFDVNITISLDSCGYNPPEIED